MRRFSLAILPAVAILAGCTDITTEVRVKDPAAVSVRVPSRDGTGQIIIASGTEPSEVPLPKGEPPYEGGVMFDASALRRPGGGIVLRCDACVGTPTKTALPDSGILTETDRWSAKLRRIIVVHGDTATIGRVRYPYLVPSGKSTKELTAFTVELETPTSNLLYARRSGGDTRVGGYVGAGVGVLLLGAASFLFVQGANASNSAGLLYAGGGLTAALGAGVTLLSLGAILRPPADEVAWPPPAPPADPDARTSETPEKQP